MTIIYDEPISGQEWYGISAEIVETEFGLAVEVDIHHFRMKHRFNRFMELWETRDLVKNAKKDFYEVIIPMAKQKGINLVFAAPVPWMESVVKRHGFVEIKKGEWYLDI